MTELIGGSSADDLDTLPLERTRPDSATSEARVRRTGEDGRVDRHPQHENGDPLDPPGEKARIVLIKEVARLVRARSRTTGDTMRLAALMIVITMCLCAVLWMMAHGTAHMVFAAF
ncbi:hypothetical protein [Actinoallomurus acaciae]|uniref:Uncharacterized protein n=1 Tax=Actinoallomurus acaciae TaxID=502577 RepID=A0ABV5YG84_9ACTN